MWSPSRRAFRADTEKKPNSLTKDATAGHESHHGVSWRRVCFRDTLTRLLSNALLLQDCGGHVYHANPCSHEILADMFTTRPPALPRSWSHALVRLEGMALMWLSAFRRSTGSLITCSWWRLLSPPFWYESGSFLQFSREAGPRISARVLTSGSLSSVGK